MLVINYVILKEYTKSQILLLTIVKYFNENLKNTSKKSVLWFG